MTRVPEIPDDAVRDAGRVLEKTFGLAAERLEPATRDALAGRCKALGIAPAEYVALLAGSDGTAGGEAWELLNGLMLGHTRFHRHEKVFDWLAAGASLRWPESAVSALVAGCSSGEDAWTLAMTLASALPDRTVVVRGLDASSAAIATAREGLYDPADVARVPPQWRQRFFEPAPAGRSRVVQSLREFVSFATANLLDPLPSGPWNLILMRNVLTYATRGAAHRMVRNARDSLVPGGLLVVAPQETHLLHAHADLLPCEPGLPIFAAIAERAPQHRPARPQVPGPGAAHRSREPTGPASPAAAHLPVAADPPGGSRIDPGVLRAPARGRFLYRDSPEWADLEGALRSALADPPDHLDLDLSGATRSDPEVARKLRSAIRLLSARGCRVRFKQVSWISG
jgi:chemotaxis methyl-accepting protein methylase